MRNKWCKTVCVLIATILLMNSAIITPITAESSLNSIYSTSVEITAGNVAEIPFYISDNSGFAGFGIYVSYDSEVFTPISVSDSGGIISGRTQNTIGGSLANLPPNTIKIMFSGSKNCTDNGLLFTVKFNVNPNAVGNTTLHISYDKGDTIDEKINDVTFLCSDILLKINNETASNFSVIKLLASEAIDGKGILLSGVLQEANGLETTEIELQYDSSAFEYDSISGVISVSDIIASTNLLKFKLSDICYEYENSVLFEILFTYSNAVSASQYSFNAFAKNTTGSQGVSITECVLNVEKKTTATACIESVDGLTNNKGHTVKVPIKIKDNPGLMGYKLSFLFNKNDVTPIKTESGPLFANGSFDDNIGFKENSFDVLWNNIENINENGELLYVYFEIETDSIKTATVNVSFSQPDTYNESYQNVELLCSNIKISLNSYTEIRNKKNATCYEEGYTGDVYCKECGEKISGGEIIPCRPHTTTTHERIEPTYEKDGNIAYFTCVNCGKYFNSAGQEIDESKIVLPKLIHSFSDQWSSDEHTHWHACVDCNYSSLKVDEENHFGGTATCKQKAICEICGTEYGNYTEHHLSEHKRVEPTFESNGNIVYWTCDECGKCFSDAEGKNEINLNETIIGKLTIKKLIYLYGEVLIEVPSNAVSGDFEITVQKIVPPPEEIVEKVKDTYGESSEVLAYYEIRMFNENGERIYYLNNEITVKSKLPEKYRTGYVIKMNQEDDNGNLVEMQSWREDEYICYKTDWLEKY